MCIIVYILHDMVYMCGAVNHTKQEDPKQGVVQVYKTMRDKQLNWETICLAGECLLGGMKKMKITKKPDCWQLYMVRVHKFIHQDGGGSER